MIVSREEAERRRELDPYAPPKERAKDRPPFFDDVLDAKAQKFNLRYAVAEGTLLSQFRHLHTDINGISALMIECKNTNRGEAIAFGVSGSQILRQGVAISMKASSMRNGGGLSPNWLAPF